MVARQLRWPRRYADLSERVAQHHRRLDGQRRRGRRRAGQRRRHKALIRLQVVLELRLLLRAVSVGK